jgi:hypothetical protein
MASLLEAIEIKRKMFFEHEGAPYHCLDVEVSKPTARGGQTLVRARDTSTPYFTFRAVCAAHLGAPHQFDDGAFNSSCQFRIT